MIDCIIAQVRLFQAELDSQISSLYHAIICHILHSFRDTNVLLWVSLILWQPSCWPHPHIVISLWSAWGYQVHPVNGILASLFAKSASFHNPFIYIGTCSKFRKDLQALFCCLKPSAAQSTSPQMPLVALPEDVQLHLDYFMEIVPGDASN